MGIGRETVKTEDVAYEAVAHIIASFALDSSKPHHVSHEEGLSLDTRIKAYTSARDPRFPSSTASIYSRAHAKVKDQLRSMFGDQVRREIVFTLDIEKLDKDSHKYFHSGLLA